ncbi:deoxyribodipyrimidine photo-lyase [Streptomyces sp. MST-110588]|uniref:cryptochrome/photolyase family protein n=1 Tax=Streptomyces sp. MST-110588 TaxID=2833628 RepID=UPI001F5D1234|nr:deoxyribodipyrimidine photo-lyase [Streptomyces sp. MST-110588]UNO39214.1 deoxyribodipyrimidine photo-lyase [Streptomyces sp. MST-110588]
METTICLFTSDLRLRDQPVLHAAVRSGARVVPLFVVDCGIADAGFAAPNRAAFLAEALADLDAGLRARGGRLVVRTGESTAVTCEVAAEAGAARVHIAAGVSGYALRRERRLRQALGRAGRELVVHDAVITVVPPGEVVPSGRGRDHFAVFTPYFRQWQRAGLRTVLPAPRAVRVPEEIASEPLPTAQAFAPGGRPSPGIPRGGEGAGRRRLSAWMRSGVAGYEEQQDDLSGDATSRLSPYLHFGCLSPVEVVRLAGDREDAGAEAFVRQLAWRDFHHQVLAARPDAAHTDYRTRHDRWRQDAAEAASEAAAEGDPEATAGVAREIAAWKEGRTGYPVVDAAMRQLLYEGWMHNRARMLVASFLTKTLYVDWRVGARHFLDLLVDGDLANNQLNWQWMAGTGTDSRPHRVLNPLIQAKRFDPYGEYVRRWVPELAGARELLPGAAVHQPWKLPDAARARLDYPEPVVDLATGLARFRHARGLDRA